MCDVFKAGCASEGLGFGLSEGLGFGLSEGLGFGLSEGSVFQGVGTAPTHPEDLKRVGGATPYQARHGQQVCTNCENTEAQGVVG